MWLNNQAAEPRVHELAIRIARRCRFLVQACLREEEWADADQEFYRVCREEIEAQQAASQPADAGKDRP